MKSGTTAGIVVVLIIIGAVAYYIAHPLATPTPSGAAATPIATAAYTCDAEKTILAAYYGGTTTPGVNGRPPTPGGRVALVLSDGRAMTLPQTISASGIRYANPDESFIFWSKGESAFVMEGPDGVQTYSNCVQQS